MLKKFILLFLISIFTGQAAVAGDKEIVFAISPMASPLSTLSGYNDFINYLSEKTGRKVALKQRRTYSEINNLLRTGAAHFSFTCTGAYLDGKSEFGLALLAVPVINGKTTYHSYIIAGSKNGVENFGQLRGRVFAFTDPLSFTGRLYPLYLLRKAGLKPEMFFRKTFYTASHEKSIESVAYGLADGASVDSLVFDNMKGRKDPTIEKVKVLNSSPPYGMPPVVVSPVTDKTTEKLMRDILLQMSADPEGMKILNKLRIDRFIPPDLSIYRTAEELRNTVGLP
ncbi:MAG: phosphate/phosphite/phosphonate ABC transporter substrate-binding protein [Nitrospirae bacterium]|nr:phosphate/phosphite/phosphonate ABC transporter substrate-binding protein [Nitrospirota bacterium]